MNNFNSFESFKNESQKYQSMTVNRGHDGFGSQMYATIIGYCAAKHINKKFYYNSISGFNPRLGKCESEKNNANVLLNNLMKNLNVKNFLEKSQNESCIEIQLPYACVTQESFSQNTLKELQNAWPLEKPDFLKEGHNICIHVRRGADLVNPWQKQLRWIESDVYEKLIYKLFDKYPNSKIHVFCWGDSGLNHINNPNLILHVSNGFNDFIADYNAFIHADILFTAISTFSISAGFFNKNIVLCSNDYIKFNDLNIIKEPSHRSPFPHEWELNYNKIFKN